MNGEWCCTDTSNVRHDIDPREPVGPAKAAKITGGPTNIPDTASSKHRLPNLLTCRRITMAIEQFTRKLTDSGLMSAEQLDAFCNRLPETERPQAADELSKQLVEHDVLTEYQADALASEDDRPLVVGDYVIQERVGAGGMGTVYKAQHRRMKRTVALKMVQSQNDDESALRRFEREVEAAGRLSHPNVVAALDARQHEGTDYLIMEYVNGRDLWAVIEKSGPLPVDKAVNYTLQAARGCLHAHQLGIVHRDIKPSNLLVDGDEVVKILDMGLARLDTGASDPLAPTQANLTGENVIMGTLDFVSPEQALNAHRVDHRTDIYSLGCTLYYLLAGKPIYAGETAMEKLIGHREQPVPSLHDVAQDVPAGLEQAYRRMVAKKPDDRFQTMEDVISALEQAWEPIAAPPRRAPGSGSVVLEPEEDPDIVFADVVENPTEAQTPFAPVMSSTPAKPVRRPGVALLKFVFRVTGLVLGLIAGPAIAESAGAVGIFVAVVFFGLFGWYCGGGYAAMVANRLGWADLPENTAGHFFRASSLPIHLVFILVGGGVGAAAGSPLSGIFVALTVWAGVDRLRRRS